MGAFLPTLALSALQMGVEAVQRSKQVATTQAAQEADARYRIEGIQSAQRAETAERQRALKEALASQRARFGAQGLGLGGSADAVLRGLRDDAAEQDRRSRELARLKGDRINSDTAWAGRRNLLELSQPTYRAAFDLARKGVQRTSLVDF